MATYGYEYKPDINNMSYDETCIALFGMDADELREKHEKVYTDNQHLGQESR